MNLKTFFTALLLTVGLVTSAQTVTGIVTSDDGPLPGATVVVKGTSNGVSTDFDGNFSINAPADAILEVSFVGFSTQDVSVNGQDNLTITLATDNELDEVIVTGYGSQKKKEITSAVAVVGEEDFNKGTINSATELLQGKVAGLSIYNRGGNPNSQATIRLRGISSIGSNVQPLVVIDGIIGGSLQNLDPNDIESINVLKDGSAGSIYGTRGSSGVILVTTKKGKNQKTTFNYNGQLATSSAFKTVNVLTADEFRAAGGTDLGSDTDWINEVIRNSVTQIHNFSATGGHHETTYRISANLRDVDGILTNSGFDQFNARANFSSKAFNEKLKIDFNSSFTRRNQQNGFAEALRYAVLYNPTAPVLGVDSPFPFNSDQFGGYFESLGLFDSFNPVAIANLNQNNGNLIEFNYGLNLNYSFSDTFSLNLNIAQQESKYSNKIYYPTTSHFRGNATSPIRKGRAEFYENKNRFKLAELYGTYDNTFGVVDLTFTGGYSFQQFNFEDFSLGLGDFPNDDINFADAIENSQDLNTNQPIAANSNVSPDERIIAFFGRLNLTIDDAIFLNASIRREGSSKLGKDNRIAVLPAIGVGIDLNHYLELNNVELLKIRLGYGTTGSLPSQNGLDLDGRIVTENSPTGGFSTQLVRAANPDLKWESKGEINFGVEFNTNRFAATLDLYNRDIKDFILLRTIENIGGVNQQYQNAGNINTKGVELALNYDFVKKDAITYNAGIVLSSYETVLEEYITPREVRSNLGAPGQNDTPLIRVFTGEPIGQIWGPVYDSVDADGNPVFKDLNGDGVLKTDSGNALDDDVDFAVLGNGIPDLELGWTNQLSFGKWSVNAFFRAAFGHSLVNTFRAFYEPRLSSQSSYNYVTSELAVPGLTTARFSSLYVEKADFFKLDNLTVNYAINTDKWKSIDGLDLSLNGQNLFVITGYTGLDPEPALVDNIDPDNLDVLSPGIDRRTNYFASRTFTFGVNLKF
ncbi:SusC/RagA family TonB-linked outer membrane protein [Flavobacteriaceae bacterium]|nr:SusC/RagA family TonB-linked outer membrane protein [Flavobacteriaceae bacterium]